LYHGGPSCATEYWARYTARQPELNRFISESMLSALYLLRSRRVPDCILAATSQYNSYLSHGETCISERHSVHHQHHPGRRLHEDAADHVRDGCALSGAGG